MYIKEYDKGIYWNDLEKAIYNQALEDFLKRCLDENIQFYLNPIDCMREVKDQLKR